MKASRTDIGQLIVFVLAGTITTILFRPTINAGDLSLEVALSIFWPILVLKVGLERLSTVTYLRLRKWGVHTLPIAVIGFGLSFFFHREYCIPFMFMSWALSFLVFLVLESRYLHFQRHQEAEKED